jgi:hypothetical protein
MKTRICLLLVQSLSLLTPTLTTSLAGQPDRRFDGVWVGIETFHRGDAIPFNPKDAIAKRTVIAIADSGKRLGIVEGANPGQYQVTTDSNGPILWYQVPGWDTSLRATLRMKPGRRCKLTLSADGNTLTEDGLNTTATKGANPADFQNIKGLFHRQSR